MLDTKKGCQRLGFFRHLMGEQKFTPKTNDNTPGTGQDRSYGKAYLGGV